MISGLTDPLVTITAAICFLSVIAAFTDVLYGKIYNWLTLPAIMIGIGLHVSDGGSSGFLFSIAGAGLGFLILLWMFFSGIMGGGDVKLLTAFGAWGGATYVFHVALLSILLGAVFGLFQLALKGKLNHLIKKFGTYFLGLLGKVVPVQMPEIDQETRMHFGVPMGAAAIWTIFRDPLESVLRGLF